MTEHRSAEEVVAGLDLRGKTIAVTGVSSGLGVESARVLAGAGARVIGAARDLEKARKALDGSRVDLVPLDLTSLASVRACAAAIEERAPRLDVLINNAGIMACPRGATQDGFELQFGTNHLGHFLLTCLLVPRLLAAAPSRIVCLSSGGHRIAGVDLDDPFYERWKLEMVALGIQGPVSARSILKWSNATFSKRTLKQGMVLEAQFLDANGKVHAEVETTLSGDKISDVMLSISP